MTLSHSPNIVRDGLVLYLDAANPKSYPGSGTTWYDLSGNNNDADVVGSDVFSTQDLGKFDYRGVSQVTDYIRLPHSVLQENDGNYTIVFWMQPQSSGTRYFHSVANSGNNNIQIIQITSTIQSWNGGSSISFNNNEILQLSLVRSGSNSGTIYKNGNYASASSTLVDLSSVDNNGWNLNQEQDTVDGGFSSAQNAYAAFMSVKFYNKALSSEELNTNFNALRGRYGI